MIIFTIIPIANIKLLIIIHAVQSCPTMPPSNEILNGNGLAKTSNSHIPVKIIPIINTLSIVHFAIIRSTILYSIRRSDLILSTRIRSNQKDHFIRYRNKKDERMTLIIGFVNHAGIAIVSDTQITNTETLEPSYSKKILTPLRETPFLVGAAGYTNLFQEFNRKIPEVVEQRLKQYKIMNIQELMKVGYTRDQAILRVQLHEKNLAKTQAVQETQEKIEKSDSILEDNIIPPFVYSGEDFLDDCRSKIKEITSGVNHPNPLELLIGQKRRGLFPSLFYMSPMGRVEQIWTYAAIGSGQPYVKMFFDRLYDADKSMNQLITDAFRAIVYTKSSCQRKLRWIF